MKSLTGGSTVKGGWYGVGPNISPEGRTPDNGMCDTRARLQAAWALLAWRWECMVFVNQG